MSRNGFGTDASVGTAAVVTAASFVAALIAWVTGSPVIDGVFIAIVLAVFALVLRGTVISVRTATVARRVAAELATTQPSRVAREAVRQERRRLADDIAASLHEAIRQLRSDADAALGAADPLPFIRRIRDHSRIATSELRRQLGLLSAPEAEVVDDPPDGAAPVHTPRDLVLGLSAVALALLECLVTPLFEGESPQAASTALTVLVAAAGLGRRHSPALAAGAMSVGYLAAIPLQVPIQSGFWSMLAVAPLIWTVCATPGSRRTDLAAIALLCLASGVSVGRLDPDNLGLWLVVLVVSVGGGLIVGRSRRHTADSQLVAELRRGELAAAAEVAVAAEQRVFAHELHDVVSHAIGLVAVQASAAEVSWPNDREATRHCLRVVRDSAAHAADELDRLLTSDHPDATARQPRGTPADLDDLACRIRLAGTPVTLEVATAARSEVGPTAYRVVQEALTNVLRHAPGASARVVIALDDQGNTLVRVTDTGPPVTGVRRGFGLVGLGERVELAGGTLEAGPTGQLGGFTVSATLPALAGLLR